MWVMSREDLIDLIRAEGRPAISIYMPTERRGDLEGGPPRLKNLLRVAEQETVQYGMRSTEARELLGPAARLLLDEDFWQHQGNGLALFISPGYFKYFRLPLNFQELAVVSEHFHIKPLVPLFSEDGLFYILALSQKMVKLLQCTRDNLRNVRLENVPRSLPEALAFDEPERQLQFHSGTGGGGGGRRPAIFHGHGVGVDDTKTNILRYFQMVDRGLHEVLREEKAPLVLAAVDYLHPIYRQANTYANLLDRGIAGSPDEANEVELHRQAWGIVKPYFERGLELALTAYGEANAVGLATSDLKEVVLAAYDGRVDTLMVAPGMQRWGLVYPEARELTLHDKQVPGDYDLLDFATAHTLAGKGKVYLLDEWRIPGSSTAAAILRY